jgi:hypothetical protein
MNEPDDRGSGGDRPLAEPCPTLAFVFERRWLPSSAGALGKLAYTNVPHAVPGGSAAFDWGNHSPGAYELALNVAETALEQLHHHGPRTAVDGRPCFVAARLLQRSLVEEMIAVAPDDGATIPTHEIERWLGSKLDGLDSAARAMLAPRYQLSSEPGCWSAAELEAILDGPLSETPEGVVDARGNVVATPVVPHPLETAAWELPPI